MSWGRYGEFYEGAADPLKDAELFAMTKPRAIEPNKVFWLLMFVSGLFWVGVGLAIHYFF